MSTMVSLSPCVDPFIKFALFIIMVTAITGHPLDNFIYRYHLECSQDVLNAVENIKITHPEVVQPSVLRRLKTLITPFTLSELESMSQLELSNCIYSKEENWVLKAPQYTTKNPIFTHPLTSFSHEYLVSTEEAWQRDRLNQPALPLDRDYSRNVPTGSDNHIEVYVVDSGIDRNNDALKDKLAGDDSYHYDAYYGSGTETCYEYACDCYGHGTMVASLVASEKYGYNPNTTLHAVKVVNCHGEADFGNIVTAAEWILSEKDWSDNPFVVNISLLAQYNQHFEDVLQELSDRGIHIICSGSSPGSDSCSMSPAGSEYVTTVNATTHTDEIASFADNGPCIDMYAPGEEIWTYSLNNSEVVVSGNSFSAPIVTGILSALAATIPELSANTVMMRQVLDCLAVKNALHETTDSRGLVYDGYYLHPECQVTAFIRSASTPIESANNTNQPNETVVSTPLIRSIDSQSSIVSEASRITSGGEKSSLTTTNEKNSTLILSAQLGALAVLITMLYVVRSRRLRAKGRCYEQESLDFMYQQLK
eukprot:CAMPEP_0114989740 /NCGR_PEP_ID=MMETSP0216-20121206/10371_1 /TAXON_ID=223996 /ORGANISM="Protocruzia adherens, Strain Boccale" /LENGTH=535 /DNA_ID=CAMNT_0002352763 /DNA_START=20 /DNA_END=1627 /DNA_ORIENTATION=-